MVRKFIQHHTNQLTVYCRLRDMGVPKRPALIIASKAMLALHAAVLAGFILLAATACAGIGLSLRPDGVTLTYSSPTYKAQADGLATWMQWLGSAPLDEAKAHAPGVKAWADKIVQAVEVAK